MALLAHSLLDPLSKSPLYHQEKTSLLFLSPQKASSQPSDKMMPLIFCIFFGSFLTVFLEAQMYPRQIMPINAPGQFSPFMPANNFQFPPQFGPPPPNFHLQRAAPSYFQPPQPNRLQNPDVSNLKYPPANSIPFQITFGKNRSQPVSSPFSGGGLVPITEKLMDSTSEKLQASVGSTKAFSAETLNPGAVSPSESLPPFIQGAPQDIIDEFKHILRQPQLPYSEKVKQIASLVSTLSQDRQQLFQQFMTPTQQPPSPETPPITRVPSRSPGHIPQRSPPKEDYFLRISKILQDESIPEAERWKQITDIYGTLEPRVKAEYPFDLNTSVFD